MDATPHFKVIDNKVLAIKRSCYLVEHLLNEKVADLMLEASETDCIDADQKGWINFLADLNKCMEKANELKPYLAFSDKIHFEQTGVNIATLDRQFFIRKYAVIEKLLADLKTSAEDVSTILSFQERAPFSVWQRELASITNDYMRLINSLKRHEKLK